MTSADTHAESLGSRIRRVLPFALPIMLGYVSIGVPCGILEAEIGAHPLLAFIVSCTFYSGAGQFMIANMVLSGMGFAAIYLPVMFVNTRQMLYSAAFSPYFSQVSKRLALLFSATVTDESFGVNMERYTSDPNWSAQDATLVNIFSMLTWASSNAVGCIVGRALDIPTEISSFAMTAIFVCLLIMQGFSRTNLVVALCAFVGVYLCKLIGLGGMSVLLAAVAAVIAGLLVKRGEHA